MYGLDRQNVFFQKTSDKNIIFGSRLLTQLSILINPPHIPRPPTLKVLKHFFRTTIRFPFLLCQHPCHITYSTPCSIPPRPKIIILRHKSKIRYSRIRLRPSYITRRRNRIIQIRIRENRPMLSVPRPSKCALPRNLQRRVFLLDLRVIDVCAELVLIRCIRAFPRGNSAAASAHHYI